MQDARMAGRLWLRVSLLLLAWLAAGPAPAEAQGAAGLEAPAALLVSGRVAGGRQWLDAERLTALGARVIEAEPPWSEEPERLAGVPLAELLAHVGASGRRLELRDARGHSLGLAIGDALARGAFLAGRRDGQHLSQQERGPFWLVFADQPGGPSRFGPPPMAGLVELRVR